MGKKESPIFTTQLYTNMLLSINETYDKDIMIDSFESMVFDELKKIGLEDELNDFIKHMPSWFRDELKLLYNDNDEKETSYWEEI